MAKETTGIKASDIKFDRYRFDVVVIGAGGAGLRAAVEARQAGLRVAIICKSLFGKAHTVMAEGGAAAAMGNVNENDGGWLSFMQKNRQTESGSLRPGARSLIAPKMVESHNVTLAAMNIRA
jgi:succinate dehydrogenase/fumarate reductase flavoprotein subunit